MTKEILIRVSTPEGIECTEREFKEWVLFNLANNSSYSSGNKLIEYEFIADDVYIRP
jgi:hypothetical protein